MSKNPGRPKEYDIDDNQKEQILNMIRDYNKNHNPYPKVKYKDIWEHSLLLHEEGVFPFRTSYDFWKRKDRVGRQLVDIVNSIEQKKIYISKSKNIDLINIKELIEKYGGKNRGILWENLEPYDRHITEFINRINTLQDDNGKLKSQLIQQVEIIKEFQQSNEKLQNLLYALFTYSNQENELVNMINTGQSKSKVINLSLEKTFENPHAFFLELQNRTNISNNSKKTKTNVVSIRSKFSNSTNDEPEYDL